MSSDISNSMNASNSRKVSVDTSTTMYNSNNMDWTLFLTRFRTYKITSTPQTKMTSKDDIKGLVSLKFLRP
jgi:hypothetical protein